MDRIFSTEEEFRSWLIENLEKLLPLNWSLLNSKNVTDIIFCFNNVKRPIACFLEVKYHKSNHGRIGFGNGKGEGFQPEILQKKPIYFEHYTRWIIANEEGTCLFFNNNDVRNNCAADTIRQGKQNNFKSNLFRTNQERCFNYQLTPQRIIEWLNSITPLE